jgi:plastocyanin
MIIGFRGSAMSAALTKLLLFIAVVTLTGFAASEKVGYPKTHTITIQGMRFSPANLEVSLGDTVIWKNQDVVPHTATSDRKSFDSGEIKAGASWKHVAKKAGSYPYICTYHPTMKAELVVR